MPRLFGLNLVGVLVASIVFFLVGFLWYGLVFAEMWMSANGVTQENAGSPLWMLGGLVITVIQVIGLGLVLKWRSVSSPGPAAGLAVILWGVFALPFVLYDYVYLPAHSVELLFIDASHLLVGWVAAAVTLTFFK